MVFQSYTLSNFFTFEDSVKVLKLQIFVFIFYNVIIILKISCLVLRMRRSAAVLPSVATILSPAVESSFSATSLAPGKEIVVQDVAWMQDF